MEACVMLIKFVAPFRNNNYKKKFSGNIRIKMLKLNKFVGLLFYFSIDKFHQKMTTYQILSKCQMNDDV